MQIGNGGRAMESDEGSASRSDTLELLVRCRRVVGALMVEIERGPRAELGQALDLLDDLTRTIGGLERALAEAEIAAAIRLAS